MEDGAFLPFVVSVENKMIEISRIKKDVRGAQDLLSFSFFGRLFI
jgi:hypothetical protein